MLSTQVSSHTKERERNDKQANVRYFPDSKGRLNKLAK